MAFNSSLSVATLNHIVCFVSHCCCVVFIHCLAVHSLSGSRAAMSKVRFPFKRNRLRCMRCVQTCVACKRKPQETQALALASSQSWLPLLRPSIPIGWRLRLLGEIFTQQTQRKRLRLNGNGA